MLPVLFFLVFIGAFGQYDVIRRYNSPDCGSSYVALSAIVHQPLSCTASTCGNCYGTTCTTVQCNVALPSDFPPYPIAMSTYPTIDCTVSPTDITVNFAGACINDVQTGGSYQETCFTDTNFGATGCTGNFTVGETTAGGATGCILLPGEATSLYVLCTDVPKCFHEDTKIQYAGETLTLAEIQKGHPSCVIPHEFKSSGYKFTTSCEGALRVTGEHLVFTQNGLVMASTIKPGDFLFQDEEQKQTCEVLKTEIEENQSYFGLNCEESVVLANGYKTSTFGIIHSLPAVWMKVASKIVGIRSASALGDAFASIFNGLF